MPTPFTKKELQEKHKSGGKHTCTRCGFVGGDSEFRTPHSKGKNGHPYYDLCKPCHIGGARASRYRGLYNITIEEYDKILAFQNGKCAICGKVAKVTQNRLAVDHCHKSGLIRGILCWHCNRAIGSFGDDQSRIWMAFLYLFSPPAIMALKERRYGIVGRVKKKAKNRVYGSAELERTLYRMNPDRIMQVLKLKAMELQEDALERAKKKEKS
jgi:Recombination endonuclease VII